MVARVRGCRTPPLRIDRLVVVGGDAFPIGNGERLGDPPPEVIAKGIGDTFLSGVAYDSCPATNHVSLKEVRGGGRGLGGRGKEMRGVIGVLEHT